MEDAQRGSERCFALFRQAMRTAPANSGTGPRRRRGARRNRRESAHAFHLSRPPRPDGTDREQKAGARYLRSGRARPAGSPERVHARCFQHQHPLARNVQSIPVQMTASPLCTSPVFSASPKPPVCSSKAEPRSTPWPRIRPRSCHCTPLPQPATSKPPACCSNMERPALLMPVSKEAGFQSTPPPRTETVRW